MTSSLNNRRYIAGLVLATENLFLEGCNDPSFEEIIRRHFGDIELPDLEVLLSNAQKEHLRRELEKAGYKICPLAEPYYSNCKRDPQTDDDVKKCLPIGAGKTTFGIKRIVGDPNEDRVWVAWTRRKVNRAQGSNDKIYRDVTEARDAGLITAEMAEHLLPGNKLDPETAKMVEAARRIFGGTLRAIEGPTLFTDEEGK